MKAEVVLSQKEYENRLQTVAVSSFGVGLTAAGMSLFFNKKKRQRNRWAGLGLIASGFFVEVIAIACRKAGKEQAKRDAEDERKAA